MEKLKQFYCESCDKVFAQTEKRKEELEKEIETVFPETPISELYRVCDVCYIEIMKYATEKRIECNVKHTKRK